MNPLLEENILKLSKAINQLVEQMQKAEKLNINSRQAGDILGYSKWNCDQKMKEHRENGDIKMWRENGREYLYDKQEILELRQRLFTEHKLRAI